MSFIDSGYHPNSGGGYPSPEELTSGNASDTVKIHQAYTFAFHPYENRGTGIEAKGEPIPIEVELASKGDGKLILLINTQDHEYKVTIHQELSELTKGNLAYRAKQALKMVYALGGQDEDKISFKVQGGHLHDESLTPEQKQNWELRKKTIQAEKRKNPEETKQLETLVSDTYKRIFTNKSLGFSSDELGITRRNNDAMDLRRLNPEGDDELNLRRKPQHGDLSIETSDSINLEIQKKVEQLREQFIDKLNNLYDVVLSKPEEVDRCIQLLEEHIRKINEYVIQEDGALTQSQKNLLTRTAKALEPHLTELKEKSKVVEEGGENWKGLAECIKTLKNSSSYVLGDLNSRFNQLEKLDNHLNKLRKINPTQEQLRTHGVAKKYYIKGAHAEDFQKGGIKTLSQLSKKESQGFYETFKKDMGIDTYTLQALKRLEEGKFPLLKKLNEFRDRLFGQIDILEDYKKNNSHVDIDKEISAIKDLYNEINKFIKQVDLVKSNHEGNPEDYEAFMAQLQLQIDRQAFQDAEVLALLNKKYDSEDNFSNLLVCLQEAENLSEVSGKKELVDKLKEKIKTKIETTQHEDSFEVLKKKIKALLEKHSEVNESGISEPSKQDFQGEIKKRLNIAVGYLSSKNEGVDADILLALSRLGLDVSSLQVPSKNAVVRVKKVDRSDPDLLVKIKQAIEKAQKLNESDEVNTDFIREYVTLFKEKIVLEETDAKKNHNKEWEEFEGLINQLSTRIKESLNIENEDDFKGKIEALMNALKKAVLKFDDLTEKEPFKDIEDLIHQFMKKYKTQGLNWLENFLKSHAGKIQSRYRDELDLHIKKLAKAFDKKLLDQDLENIMKGDFSDSSCGKVTDGMKDLIKASFSEKFKECKTNLVKNFENKDNLSEWVKKTEKLIKYFTFHGFKKSDLDSVGILDKFLTDYRKVEKGSKEFHEKLIKGISHDSDRSKDALDGLVMSLTKEFTGKVNALKASAEKLSQEPKLEMKAIFSFDEGSLREMQTKISSFYNQVKEDYSIQASDFQDAHSRIHQIEESRKKIGLSNEEASPIDYTDEGIESYAQAICIHYRIKDIKNRSLENIVNKEKGNLSLGSLEEDASENLKKLESNLQEIKQKYREKIDGSNAIKDKKYGLIHLYEWSEEVFDEDIEFGGMTEALVETFVKELGKEKDQAGLKTILDRYLRLSGGEPKTKVLIIKKIKDYYDKNNLGGQGVQSLLEQILNIGKSNNLTSLTHDTSKAIETTVLNSLKDNLSQLVRQLDKFSLEQEGFESLESLIQGSIKQIEDISEVLMSCSFEDETQSLQKLLKDILDKIEKLQKTNEIYLKNKERIEREYQGLKGAINPSLNNFLDDKGMYKNPNFHLGSITFLDIDEKQKIFLQKELSKFFFSEGVFIDYVDDFVGKFIDKKLSVENGKITFDNQQVSEEAFLKELDAYHNRTLRFIEGCISKITLEDSAGTTGDTSFKEGLKEHAKASVKRRFKDMYSKILSSKVSNLGESSFSCLLSSYKQKLEECTFTDPLTTSGSSESAGNDKVKNPQERMEALKESIRGEPDLVRALYESMDALALIGDRKSSEVLQKVLSILRSKLVEYDVIALSDSLPPIEGFIKIFCDLIDEPQNVIDELIIDRYGEQKVFSKKRELLQKLKSFIPSNRDNKEFIRSDDSQEEFLNKAQKYLNIRKKLRESYPLDRSDKLKLLQCLFPYQSYEEGITFKYEGEQFIFHCDENGRIFTEQHQDKYFLDINALLSEPDKKFTERFYHLPLRREGTSDIKLFSYNDDAISFKPFNESSAESSSVDKGKTFVGSISYSKLPRKRNSGDDQYASYNDKIQQLQTALSSAFRSQDQESDGSGSLELGSIGLDTASKEAYETEQKNYRENKQKQLEGTRPYIHNFPLDTTEGLQTAYLGQVDLFNSIEDFYNASEIELLLAEDKVKKLANGKSIESIIKEWKEGHVPSECKASDAQDISQFIVLKHFCSTFLPLYRQTRRLRNESRYLFEKGKRDERDERDEKELQKFNEKLNVFFREVDKQVTRYNKLESFSESQERSRIIFELLDDISLREDQRVLYDHDIYQSLHGHFKSGTADSSESNVSPWKKIFKLGTGYGKTTMIKGVVDLASDSMDEMEKLIVVMAPHNNQGDLNRQLDRYHKAINPDKLPIKLDFSNWSIEKWDLGNMKGIKKQMEKAKKKEHRVPVCLSMEDRVVFSFMLKNCQNTGMYNEMRAIYDMLKDGFQIYDEWDSQDKIDKATADSLNTKISTLINSKSEFDGKNFSADAIIVDQKTFMRSSNFTLGFSATIESVGSTCSMVGKASYSEACKEMKVDELTTTFRGVEWVQHAKVHFPDGETDGPNYENDTIVKCMRQQLDENVKSDFIIQDSHDVFGGDKKEAVKKIFELRQKHIQDKINEILSQTVVFNSCKKLETFAQNYLTGVDESIQEKAIILFRKYQQTKIIYQDKHNGQMVLHAYNGKNHAPITDKDLDLYRSRGGLDLCYYLTKEGETGVDVPQDWEEDLSLEKGCHTLITTRFCPLKRQLQRMGRARKMDKGQMQEIVLSKKDYLYLKKKYPGDSSINGKIALEMLELQMDEESMENDKLSCLAMISKYFEDIERATNDTHSVGESLFSEGILESLRTYIENHQTKGVSVPGDPFKFLQDKDRRDKFIAEKTREIKAKGGIHTLKKAAGSLLLDLGINDTGKIAALGNQSTIADFEGKVTELSKEKLEEIILEQLRGQFAGSYSNTRTSSSKKDAPTAVAVNPMSLMVDCYFRYGNQSHHGYQKILYEALDETIKEKTKSYLIEDRSKNTNAANAAVAVKKIETRTIDAKDIEEFKKNFSPSSINVTDIERMFNTILSKKLAKEFSALSSDQINNAYTELLKAINTMAEKSRDACFSSHSPGGIFSNSNWRSNPSPGSSHAKPTTIDEMKLSTIGTLANSVQEHFKKIEAVKKKIAENNPSAEGSNDSEATSLEQQKIDAAFALYEKQYKVFEELRKKRKKIEQQIADMSAASSEDG